VFGPDVHLLKSGPLLTLSRFFDQLCRPMVLIWKLFLFFPRFQFPLWPPTQVFFVIPVVRLSSVLPKPASGRGHTCLPHRTFIVPVVLGVFTLLWGIDKRRVSFPEWELFVGFDLFFSFPSPGTPPPHVFGFPRDPHGVRRIFLVGEELVACKKPSLFAPLLVSIEHRV